MRTVPCDESTRPRSRRPPPGRRSPRSPALEPLWALALAVAESAAEIAATAPSPAGGPAPTCTPPPTRLGRRRRRRPRRLARRHQRVGGRVPLRRPPGRGGHRPLRLGRRLPQQPPAGHRLPPRRRLAGHRRPPHPAQVLTRLADPRLFPRHSPGGAGTAVPRLDTGADEDIELASMTSGAARGSPHARTGTGRPPTLLLSLLPG